MNYTWVEVKLYSITHTGWWRFYSGGSSKELTTIFVPKYSHQNLWHPLPVLIETDLAVKVAIPFNLKYQGKEIDFFNNHSKLYGYMWVKKSPEVIRPHLNPCPCPHCDWYCSQTCVSKK